MNVGVVGTGMVGSAAANALVLSGSANEVVIDRDSRRARAEAEDILHATPFANISRVHHGDYADLTGAGAVVVAAGVNQQPGETRLELLYRNAAVFSDVPSQGPRSRPQHDPSDRPQPGRHHDPDCDPDLRPTRVIGSGTILDTARFRALLGDHLGISPKSVHAYVPGEHGNSEILCWSVSDVGSITVEALAAQIGRRPLDPAAKQRIDDGVRRAAYSIIEGKGATWYGIGGGISRTIRAIRGDEHSVLTVSVVEDDVEGVGPVALSLPRVVAGHGVTRTLRPGLRDDERALLKRSAEILKDATAGRW